MSERPGHSSDDCETERLPQRDGASVCRHHGVELHSEVGKSPRFVNDKLREPTADAPAYDRWRHHPCSVGDVVTQPRLVRLEGCSRDNFTIERRDLGGGRTRPFEHPRRLCIAFFDVRRIGVRVSAANDCQHDRPDLNPIVIGRNPVLDAALVHAEPRYEVEGKQTASERRSRARDDSAGSTSEDHAVASIQPWNLRPRSPSAPGTKS